MDVAVLLSELSIEAATPETFIVLLSLIPNAFWMLSMVVFKLEAIFDPVVALVALVTNLATVILLVTGTIVIEVAFCLVVFTTAIGAEPLTTITAAFFCSYLSLSNSLAKFYSPRNWEFT